MPIGFVSSAMSCCGSSEGLDFRDFGQKRRSTAQIGISIVRQKKTEITMTAITSHK